MSGPIVPPLEVTEVDGSPDGRPITKIVVSNGSLSISGRTATITTSGGGSGTVTSIATTGPITGGTITTTGTIAITQSDTSTDGYLSSTDWNTFNNKGSGTVTSITAAADSGSGTAITSSGTFTFTGGTGVTTAVSGTTVTITADNNGDVVGPGSSTDANVALFDGTTGKLLKDGTKGIPSGAIVGTTDSQTLTNKTIDFASNTGSNYEGTAVISTGETGATKFLREDGDGTSSWQAATATVEGTAVLSTGETAATKFLREDGDGTSSWQAATATVPDPILLGNGSAGAPTYSFTTDTDTGLFNGGGNILGFASGGTKRAEISVSGMVLGSGAATGKVTTKGAYDLEITTNEGTNSGTITIAQGVDGAISLTPNGDGYISFNSEYKFPIADGDANQVLTTDGVGALTFETPSGGGIGIVYPPVSNSQSSAQIHWGHISAPFGTSASSSQSFNTDSPCWIPIIGRRTATFTDISIQVTTGVGSTSNIDLGVYSDDSGEPGTLLGQATVDVDTSGTKSATLAAEVGESLSSIAGTQYWLCMVRQAGVGTFTMHASNKADVGQWAWTGYNTSYGIIVQSGSDNTLPASATFTTGFAQQMLAIGIDYE